MIKLCNLSDIPEGTAKGFSLEKIEIFAVHFDSQFFVYQNKCPHLEIPLEWQEDQFLDMDGELIQCSTHGALFTIESGFCVSGPCQGSNLTALKSVVENEQLYLDL